MYPLLEAISYPADLRLLKRSQLPSVANDLRQFLLDTISGVGGHFASNLGTVELAIALHYVFNTPEDKLIWDVGHQSYPHKILTGRRKYLPLIRKKNGPSGFPRRAESQYDPFGTGHSSTAISAALGFAEAYTLERRRNKTIAVVGDGAMTAGLAMEGMFNAGGRDIGLVVILNDNEMSISPNVGAFKHYLTKLLSSRAYHQFRSASAKVLEVLPPLLALARKSEEQVKTFLAPNTFFNELGLNYLGPINGHDLDALLLSLETIKPLPGPQFLHVVTKKGHGYPLAVEDPIKYHAVAPFKPQNGLDGKKDAAPITFTAVFSDWLCDMACQDPRLIGITPAMREGSGLVRFAKEYPKRYFDVGIAEQHAVTFAAGLACAGLKPVVAIYSTFLQRAYDQVIHDVALQNLPVLFAVDRAGLVGPDGPTHAGSFDLSYLRCIPNMSVLTPADENECRQMLYTAYQHPGPTAVRYPRGAGPGITPLSVMQRLPWGKGEIRATGQQLAILSFGTCLSTALTVAKTLDGSVANMRFIKPLDEALVLMLAKTHRLLVTLEENAIMGGAGSAVLESLSAQGITVPVLQLGLADVYLEHAEQAEQRQLSGLDAAAVEKAIQERLSRIR